MHDKKLKDGCYFVPLGGCEEIGRNLNTFGIVKDGKEQWIIVDAGVSIEKNFGISLQIPLFDFVLKRNLIGIVCTHGHDDHIGAIPFIVPSLNEFYQQRNPESKGIPIYSTKFTQGLIAKKFEEHHLDGNFLTVQEKKPFNVGDFEIEMIPITHSLPEANMMKIVFHPFNLKLVHTGDWKLDPDPIISEPTDEKYIQSIGEKGVDILLCDSTGALEKEHTPSEGTVKEGLDKIIKGKTGKRIIVTCFASNIARVKMIYDLAKKYNRKVVLFGKSLLKVSEVAMESGYLEKDLELLKATDVSSLDMTKTIVICSGSQGEKGAVLDRLANSSKPPFQICKDDVVIFSARKIPGNEKEIGDLQSALTKKGAEIIDSRIAHVHVSGHPSQVEIERMLRLVQPKTFIPLHGQAINFTHMLKIADKVGIQSKIMPFNGAIIELRSKEIVEQTRTGLLGLDGFQLVDMESQVVHTRKILGANGAIFISIIPGQKPIICSYGVLPDNNYKNFLPEVSRIVSAKLRQYRSINRKDIVNDIISEVNGYIRQIFGKNPLVSVHIMDNFASNFARKDKHKKLSEEKK